MHFACERFDLDLALASLARDQSQQLAKEAARLRVLFLPRAATARRLLVIFDPPAKRDAADAARPNARRRLDPLAI